MKKLSLVLALVLVLTCALVACGGETEESSTPASSTASSKVESSAAASSEAEESSESASTEDASVESSDAVAESSDEAPVESSDEAPAESSDAVVEDSSVEDSSVEDEPVEDDEPVGDPTNVALGASYDTKGYAAGGEWPADYTANLTDGVAAAELDFSNAWFGFCTSEGSNGLNAPNGVGTVTFDLGSSYNLTSIRVHALAGDTQQGSGIQGPAKIVAYVDGTLVGELKTDSNATDGGVWYELDVNAKGSSVKIEVTLTGIFCFINEVEVYGA